MYHTEYRNNDKTYNRASRHLRRAGVGGRDSSCTGDPGLVPITNSSTLSKVSGDSGLDGVLAPLEASVPPSVLQLSNL